MKNNEPEKKILLGSEPQYDGLDGKVEKMLYGKSDKEYAVDKHLQRVKTKGVNHAR